MSANDALTALRGAVPGPALQIAVGDWSLLFAAVQDRLRSIVGDHTGALECVAALDTLHASLAQQLERARHLALHDSLTGLPNRRHFCEQLDRLLTQVEPPCTGLAVLYLDLDGLKSINDSHGHDIGDELLEIVATRLRRAIRAQDMVGRLGGDEFGCLVSDPLKRDDLTHLACKVFDTVSAPLQIGHCRLIVRPSIGITTCPDEGATAAALLKQADIAMYRAKRDQTGYAFFGEAAEIQLTRVTTPALAPVCAVAVPAMPTPRSMIGSASA